MCRVYPEMSPEASFWDFFKVSSEICLISSLILSLIFNKIWRYFCISFLSILAIIILLCYSKWLNEKAEAEVKASVGTEHCSVPTEALALTFIIINYYFWLFYNYPLKLTP